MVQSAFFFAILIVASLAFLAMILPFFEPILWAVTLAVLFTPVQKIITAQLGNRHNLASLLTLLIILFAVIFPTLMLSIRSR